MKKIISLLAAFITVMSLITGVSAAANDPTLPRIIDNAGVITESYKTLISQIIADITKSCDCDVVILTTNTLDGKSITAYADDYYDSHAYGCGAQNDGLIFVLSVKSREYYTSTCGKTISEFSDYVRGYAESSMVSYLSSGEYAQGIYAYVRAIEKVLEEAKTNEPYDPQKNPIPGYDYDAEGENINLTPGETVVIAVLIGFIVSLIIVIFMAFSMKTRRKQTLAGAYIRQNSFNLTVQRDLYLYSRRTRVKVEEDSHSGGGTHMSSGGVSHGGGGGRF